MKNVGLSISQWLEEVVNVLPKVSSVSFDDILLLFKARPVQGVIHGHLSLYHVYFSFSWAGLLLQAMEPEDIRVAVHTAPAPSGLKDKHSQSVLLQHVGHSDDRWLSWTSTGHVG